jgi:methylenetetrahydrofolate dehydrogenase (NADP+)/methenyltetrahydrofolate cyclohydrolase
MSAHIIDGNALAGELKTKLAEEAALWESRGVRPGLATLLVGDDYGSKAYERRLARLAAEIGAYYSSEQLPAESEQAEVLAVVGKLNADPRVTGILVLRPLPPHISEVEVYRLLDPLKDVEAVHPVNAGLLAEGRPRFTPSTPSSMFHLLDRYVSDSGRDPKTFYDGLNMVLVGRSNNVGKPALWLGLARNATVISAHHYTAQAGRLVHFTGEADILIVAAGKPDLIRGDMVREGVIVVDVGINPKEGPDGKVHMVGDVEFASVADVAEAITPVPGGVGPVTDIYLLHNTITAARLAFEVRRASEAVYDF